MSVASQYGVVPLQYISWSILVEPSIWYKVISCVYHFDSFHVAVTPPASLLVWSDEISVIAIILK